MKDHDNGQDGRSAERIRRYVGAAMLRLDDLKKRMADPAMADRRSLTRVLDDVQIATRELEKGFNELQEASERCLKTQHFAQLAEQQAEFLIERSPTAFFVMDRDGAILRANPAAGRALNLSPPHLIGKSFLLFVNGEREQFLLQLSDAATSRSPSTWHVAVRPRDRGLASMTVVAAPHATGRVMVLLIPAAVSAHGSVESAPARESLPLT
jgi:PAS domain S-box-containing protein